MLAGPGRDRRGAPVQTGATLTVMPSAATRRAQAGPRRSGEGVQAVRAAKSGADEARSRMAEIAEMAKDLDGSGRKGAGQGRAAAEAANFAACCRRRGSRLPEPTTRGRRWEGEVSGPGAQRREGPAGPAEGEPRGDRERRSRPAGNRDVTVKELPGLNHLFQTCKTGRPGGVRHDRGDVRPGRPGRDRRVALEAEVTWHTVCKVMPCPPGKAIRDAHSKTSTRR